MKIFLDMDQGDAYLDFWVALNFPLSLKPIYLGGFKSEVQHPWIQ